MIDKHLARLVEKCCSCGYKAQAYLANSEQGEICGFKREVTITCPCCGKEIHF